MPLSSVADQGRGPSPHHIFSEMDPPLVTISFLFRDGPLETWWGKGGGGGGGWRGGFLACKNFFLAHCLCKNFFYCSPMHDFFNKICFIQNLLLN